MQGLSFEAVDTPAHQQRYPGLGLAWAALDAPPGTTAVLNATNEVAVEAFLQRKIRFDQIHHVNTEVLECIRPVAPETLDDLLEIDRQSRQAAENAVSQRRA